MSIKATIHPAFGNKGEPEYYVVTTTGGKAKKLKGLKQIDAFLLKLKSGDSVLITPHALGYSFILQKLFKAGVTIMTCHWHNSGVPKGLKEGEIATAYSKIDESLLREFHADPAVIDLRDMVRARENFQRYTKAMRQQNLALRRSMGLPDAAPKGKNLFSGVEWLQALEKAVDEVEDATANVYKDVEDDAPTPVDKVIIKLAKTIPLCVLFNNLADMKDGYLITAQIVSYLLDVDRFPQVSSLWHYAIGPVTDGKVPKREKGKSVTWRTELKTAMWKLVDAIIKNRGKQVRAGKAMNRWAKMYEEEVAKELAVHLTKHPGCEQVQGHSGARARRKVMQEILLEFWVSARKVQTNVVVQPTGLLSAPKKAKKAAAGK